MRWLVAVCLAAALSCGMGLFWPASQPRAQVAAGQIVEPPESTELEVLRDIRERVTYGFAGLLFIGFAFMGAQLGRS